MTFVRKISILAIFALSLAVGVLFGLHQGLPVPALVVTFGACLGLAGTIVATPVINNNNYKSWTITCADADTTVTIAHGFGTSPALDCAWIQSYLVNGGGTTTALVSLWGCQVVGTGIVLTKENLAGSGGTTAGTSVVAKLFAWRPHSAAQ
jgi:hypothetical protein